MEVCVIKPNSMEDTTEILILTGKLHGSIESEGIDGGGTENY